MKKKMIILLLVSLPFMTACGVNQSKDLKSKKKASSVSISSKSSASNVSSSDRMEEQRALDIAGLYYTTSGKTASLIKKSNNYWEISYCTLDGDITATFDTKWEIRDGIEYSKTEMKKSDGSSNFLIEIIFRDLSDVTITMTDSNPEHEMIFSKNKPEVDGRYALVLTGDLSSFAGQFSSDKFNKTIADSGFTYGGYSPDDYYKNQTTVFPAITDNGYWNGISSHGSYEVQDYDLPRQIDGYYKVNVYGVNFGAGAYEENNPQNRVLTFYLVPPNVNGPDGTISSEKRVFQENADGETIQLQYQTENWWKEYQ